MDQTRGLLAISARDLGRKVAEVLDRVEIEGEALLVTRSGRPVATLLPLNFRLDDHQEPLVVVLSPLQEKILSKAADIAPRVLASFDEFGDCRELGSALFRLEAEQLLERGFAGYGVTQRGALVAAFLPSADDADP